MRKRMWMPSPAMTWTCGILCALAACADGGDPAALAGLAALDRPIVGATVTVTTPDGATLFAEADETHATGAFLLAPPGDLPADFDLTVTGGTVGPDGPAFDGTLRMEVRDHAPGDHAFYLVDPVSTLAAAWRRAAPGRTVDQARAAVWAFLALPDGVDHANDLHFATELFDPALFMAQAEASGGLDAFVAQLVAEIDGTMPTARCFSARCAPVPRGAATFIAGALAEGALSYVGEQAAGWAMNQAFGWEDADAASRARIESALAEQARMLHAVIAELESLENAIAASTSQILAELAATRYDLKASNLTAIRGFASHAYELLYFLAIADPSEATYRNQVDNLATTLASRTLAADLATIHETLVGTAPGEPGLLDIWGGIQHGRSVTTLHADELARHLTYWYDSQVRVLNLLVEHLHYRYPDDRTIVANAIQAFRERLPAQTEVFLKWNESMAYVDYFSAFMAGFPFEDRMDSLCLPPTTFPHLVAADRLAGEILGRQRSLVVRLYLSAARTMEEKVRMDPFNVLLHDLGNGDMLPGTATVHEIPVWPSGPHKLDRALVARVVYADLPPGEYQVVDTNADYVRVGTHHDPLLPPEVLDQVIALPEGQSAAGVTGPAWNAWWLNSSNGCQYIP